MLVFLCDLGVVLDELLVYNNNQPGSRSSYEPKQQQLHDEAAETAYYLHLMAVGYPLFNFKLILEVSKLRKTISDEKTVDFSHLALACQGSYPRRRRF